MSMIPPIIVLLVLAVFFILHAGMPSTLTSLMYINEDDNLKLKVRNYAILLIPMGAFICFFYIGFKELLFWTPEYREQLAAPFSLVAIYVFIRFTSSVETLADYKRSQVVNRILIKAIKRDKLSEKLITQVEEELKDISILDSEYEIEAKKSLLVILKSNKI